MHEVRTRRPIAISTIGMSRNRRPSYSWKVYRSQRQMIHAPATMTYNPGLGFSLNPLKLIASAGRAVVGAIKGTISKSTVTVPTDVGNVSVPFSKLPGMVKGSTVQFGEQPGAMERVGQAVESIPGGWATLALVGVGAALLLSRRR